jgi:two-component system, cell cycle response regulator DivK
MKMDTQEQNDDQIILVVEKDEVTYRVIASLLQKYSCKVVRAMAGMEAVKIAVENHPDLILCDMRLPDLDDYAFPPLVYQYPDMQDIPIVGMSNFCSEETKKAAIEAGCIDCIPKPVTAHEIQQMLIDFLPTITISI